ncbi:MAG: thermonuclease family protein [Verrucomicrobia bacterium]|nr:thermonuclease family protein [Verrucomicrobiota bacterium]
MNSHIAMLLVLLLAVLLAAMIFCALRISSLTERVNALEEALESRSETISSDESAEVEEKIAPPDGSKHEVLRVVDGDTVVIRTAGGSVRVRVIGIDTPETVRASTPVEAWGPQASERARELLEGRKVTIHYDPDPAHDRWDRYGRLLVYLDLPDGRDFGLVMIEEGYARAFLKYPCARGGLYASAERLAQQKGVGMWADHPAPTDDEAHDTAPVSHVPRYSLPSLVSAPLVVRVFISGTQPQR